MRSLLHAAVTQPLWDTCDLIVKRVNEARKAREVRTRVPRVTVGFLLCDERAARHIEDPDSDLQGYSAGQLGTYFTKKAEDAFVAFFHDRRQAHAGDDEHEERLAEMAGSAGRARLVGRAVLSQLSPSGPLGIASLWDVRKNLMALCVPRHHETYPGYCVRRLMDLARDKRLSQYLGDSGGPRGGRHWSDELPTDAELCLHAFANMMDMLFASKTEEKDLSVPLDKRNRGHLFRDAFLATPQSVDPVTLADRKLPLLELRHARPLDIAVRYAGRIFEMANTDVASAGATVSSSTLDGASGPANESSGQSRRSEREMLFRALGVFFVLMKASLRISIGGKRRLGGSRLVSDAGSGPQGLPVADLAGVGLRGRVGRRAASRPRRRASRGRNGVSAAGAYGSKMAGLDETRVAELRLGDLPMQHGVKCAVDFERD